ncbi:MAG: PilZ domain-containing protein [Acidobacteria bacterium]|nr:PilZ domain-containing protein [Acidobacteriota bacterium]
MAKILVVCGNSADREVRALVLEFAGYSCATAGSVEEAGNLLQKAFFDLVVTDLKMGGYGPEHIIRTLKGASPEVVVIALAQSSESLELADEIVRVPCSPKDLVQRITQALSKSVRARARSMREKRRFPRYPVLLPCLVKTVRGRKPLEGSGIRTITRNASRGGLCFVGAGEWKVGADLECVVELPTGIFGDRPKGILSQGKTVWTKPGEREGIAVGASIDRFEFVDIEK